MEQRITSLLLPAPEAELEASCKELDEKVTWLLHNSRKMDNYLELEPFSKDGRLCAHVCDTLKSLPISSLFTSVVFMPPKFTCLLLRSSLLSTRHACGGTRPAFWLPC